MPRRTVYKYNPQQCTREDLEGTFVAREATLQSLLDTLRERTLTPVNQHFLITGPRGVGKTNLLLMIRHRVEQDERLSRAYQVVQTAEEEYSISTLRDLMARLLEILADDVSDADLRGAVSTIARIANDDEAAEAGIQALKAFCGRCHRKLLLLVDNLDLILDEQWASVRRTRVPRTPRGRVKAAAPDDAQLGRLRDVLMNDSFLVLVGAAPTHFLEVAGHDRPFYQFFRPIRLDELSPEQMTELLLKRAERDDNRVILDNRDTVMGRMRAVHHLTGGNPRLVLMLHQLCTTSDLPDVREAIQTLLDEVTPYYKGRLEELGPQERRVIDTFARIGRPATPTELAAETRFKVNQVTSLLARLVDRGFLVLAPQERRKKTYYMVSERVFRIWHQMRFSTSSRRRLEFLIEFIRIWYTAQEWQQESRRLLGAYRDLPRESRTLQGAHYVEHLGYLAAAAPSPQERYNVEDELVRTCIEARDFDSAAAVLEARRREEERRGERDRLADTWYLFAHLHSERGDRALEMAALEKAIEVRPGFAQAFYGWGTAVVRLADEKTGAERVALLEQACEKYAGAVRVKPDKHEALYNWGVALYRLADEKSGAARGALLEQACEKYAAAVDVKPDKYEALNNWGIAIDRLADEKRGAARVALLEQASEKYAAAVDVKPDMHEALYNWGTALAELAHQKSGAARVALLEQACEKYAAAVGVKPDMHEALNNWGTALAERAHEKSGAARLALLEQACEKYAAAVGVKPDMHEALDNWGTTLTDLAGEKSGAERGALLEQACEKYAAAVGVTPDKHEALYNWGTALASLAGEKSGPERRELLNKAIAKLSPALDLVRAARDAKNLALYSARALRLRLMSSWAAVVEDNRGDARRHFQNALKHLPDATVSRIARELALFFRQILTPASAEMCAELLEMMRSAGLQAELEAVAPFVHAVEYWQKGEDLEVLDRLNPEVRSLVEDIIRGPEKPEASPPN